VIGNVFDALIQLDADAGVRFVTEYLSTPQVEIRDEAALSLGASRRSDAVRILMETWNSVPDNDFRSVLSRALSSSREEAAIEFLFNVAATGSTREAAAALEALKMHEDSEEIKARIEAAKK